MALARTRLDIESIRGSIGPVTYAVRRTVGRVGARRGRRGGPSEARDAAEARLRLASRAWGELTDPQRAEWRTWADQYGQAVDPENVPTVDGRQRFIGQHTLRSAVGLPPLSVPQSPGIGDAGTALLDFTPDPGSSSVEVVMLEPYPAQPFTPTRTAIYLGPPQALSRSAFRSHFRHVHTVGLDGKQPGEGAPPLSITSPWTYERGQMFWAASRTVTAAGNTSDRARWPVLLPDKGRVVAFKMRPTLPEFAPQTVQRTADDRLVMAGEFEGTEFEIAFDLTDPATDTIGELFAQINAASIWEARTLNPSSSARPSTDLPVVGPISVVPTQQPYLFTIPE